MRTTYKRADELVSKHQFVFNCSNLNNNPSNMKSFVALFALIAIASAAPQQYVAPAPVRTYAPAPVRTYAPAPAPVRTYAPAPAPVRTYAPAPAPDYGAEPVYADVPPAYDFNYAVSDSYHGVNFNANENRNGYSTNGEYRVALPDGRTQIVTYTVADAASGYVADVKYEGEPIAYVAPAAPSYAPAPVVVTRPAYNA